MRTKTALVTGAGKGIGRGIALELAGQGYNLVLHCNTSLIEAQQTAASIRDGGRSAVVLQADLSRAEEIGEMFGKLEQKGAALDLVVCNSGVTVCRPLLKLTPEDVDLVTGLDWRGSFLVSQRAALHMIDRKLQGHIVLITSNQAHMVYPDGSVYGSIKAALSHFCRCAAVELAKYGIRVNAVAPGYTDTGDERMGDRESTYASIPMGRWCTPQEIGKAIAYLDSSWSRSITGAELLIDGGGRLTCRDDRPHE